MLVVNISEESSSQHTSGGLGSTTKSDCFMFSPLLVEFIIATYQQPVTTIQSSNTQHDLGDVLIKIQQRESKISFDLPS
jgi:hypothetical protein